MKAGKTNGSQRPRHWLLNIHRAYAPQKEVIPGSYYINPTTEQKGADMMQTTTAPKEQTPCEPRSFTKRIGSTNYRVSVHFSKTSRETIDDKILRLAKNEAAKP